MRPFNWTDFKFRNITVTLDMVDLVKFTLSEINPEDVSAVKLSFRESGVYHSRGLLTVKLSCLNVYTAAIDGMLILRPDKQYYLVDGRHRFQAMQKLAKKQSDARWNFTMALRISLIEQKDGRLLSPRVLLFGCKPANKLTCKLQTDNRFVATILRLLQYAKHLSWSTACSSLKPAQNPSRRI